MLLHLALLNMIDVVYLRSDLRSRRRPLNRLESLSIDLARKLLAIVLERPVDPIKCRHEAESTHESRQRRDLSAWDAVVERKSQGPPAGVSCWSNRDPHFADFALLER